MANIYRVYQKKLIVLWSAFGRSIFNIQKSFFHSSRAMVLYAIVIVKFEEKLTKYESDKNFVGRMGVG